MPFFIFRKPMHSMYRVQATGYFRLRFVDAGHGASDWDDLHLYRRVRAVIGICHCPSESDLRTSYNAFMRHVAAYPYTAQAASPLPAARHPPLE